MNPDSMKDYLEKKKRQLGMDRADQLKTVQRLLDERYGARARAVSLQDGVLKVTSTSSAIASDIRLNQVDIITQVRAEEITVTRLQISSRG